MPAVGCWARMVRRKSIEATLLSPESQGELRTEMSMSCPCSERLCGWLHRVGDLWTESWWTRDDGALGGGDSRAKAWSHKSLSCGKWRVTEMTGLQDSGCQCWEGMVRAKQWALGTWWRFEALFCRLWEGKVGWPQGAEDRESVAASTDGL